MTILYSLLRRGIIAMALILICVFSVAAEEFTIVIDAGHGGKDVGAVDNQVREKDINLAVALELGRLIDKKLKDVNVVYTRDKDSYLTLQQRAEIANKAKGDLFISIHTNSVAMSNKKRRTICGASTYTLGLHKDEDNMEVARRENAVMILEKDFQKTYQGFNPNSDESYIIFELSQKTNMSQSIKLANDIQKQLAKVANRQDRGVHQAGFWVLWATSMPAVLVELDFICNPVSANYLASENGQKQLANGIFNAVESYYNNIISHSSSVVSVDDTPNNTESKVEIIEESNASVEDFSAQVVIQSNRVNDVVKKSKAPNQLSQQSQSNNNSGRRRRRSMESKQASEQQEYQTAVIQEKKQPYYQMIEGQEIVLEEVEKTLASEQKTIDQEQSKHENDKKKHKSAKKRTSSAKLNKKTHSSSDRQFVASVDSNTEQKSTTKSKTVSSKQTNDESTLATKSDQKKSFATVDNKQNNKANGKSYATDSGKKNDVSKSKNNTSKSKSRKAKLNKKTIVYKIYLLSSDELLRAGDERFCGLKPIRCKLSKGTYLYTFGESENENDMQTLLKKVQQKIPNAYVMKDTKFVK